MRGITGTLVILFIAGYWASTIKPPRAWSKASSPEITVSREITVTNGWRRTATGWERHESWKHPRTVLDPPPVAWRIHPFVIAAFQVLVSLFALLLADQTPCAANAGVLKSPS